MADKKSRVALQFNDYDFRHKKVLEILRSRPRHMTELVVDAILHYIVCPEAGSELSKEWVREIVKEELAGLEFRPAQTMPSRTESHSQEVMDEDLADLGDVMLSFRRVNDEH